MHKSITILAFAVAILSGFVVLQLKLSVQAQSETVETLARQIHRDREAIRVLEAEWAHLTTPSMLQDRSIRFMALMPPKAEQIVESPIEIPYRADQSKVVDPDAGVLLPPAKRLGANKEGRRREKLKRRELRVRFGSGAQEKTGEAL
jgi:hypothetical protein